MSNPVSLRKRVFAELDKNPLLTAEPICRLMGLNYRIHGSYVKKLKYDWKRNHEVEQGSIRCFPDDVHNAFFVGVLPVGVVAGVRAGLEGVWGRVGFERVVFGGWRWTRSRNRFLLFKCGLGRIRLFDSGTVELYVRKPASLGKAMQLFCDGFTKTLLVTDLAVLDVFQRGLRIRGFHATFDMRQRLPYAKIQVFKGTNGFELILGDRTHPSSVELVIQYQEQVEGAKRLFEQLSEVFGVGKPNGNGKGDFKIDYSR